MSRTAVIYIRVNSLVLAFERTLSATLLPGLVGSILSTEPESDIKQISLRQTVLNFFLYLPNISKNAADIQIPTAYKKALKLKLFRTENKGGSPSGSAAIARFRALLSFVFYCVALFVAGA